MSGLLVAVMVTAVPLRAADAGELEMRLKARAELACEGLLHLERTDSAIEIYGGGWKLKRFRIRSSSSGEDRRVSVARVVEVIPNRLPPQKVIDVGSMESPDPSGTASSPDEIVGVGEMPTGFRVRLDDGTLWLVTSSLGGSLLAEGRGVWERLVYWLSEANESTPPLTLVLLRTDPTSARHLFWIIQKDMVVIQ